MKVEIKRTGPPDDPTYVLERQDGKTLETKDLVLVRQTVTRWEEKEWRPRTVREALNCLGAEIQMLRPSVNPMPSKEQIRNAGRVVRQIKRLSRKGKLRTGAQTTGEQLGSASTERPQAQICAN